MAEVLEGYPRHVVLSLVNRTRPALPPGMSSKPEPIIISDDDDDDIEVVVAQRPRQRLYETDEAGSSTRPRHEHSTSPSLHRDTKRPRLDQESASSDPDAVVKTEFPKIKINFETDENGNSQLYPSFFEDAFILNPTPNNEEVQVIMEVPRQKEEEPPYFEDPKLQIRMYRGPGYEQFPIPFNASHQEFCDIWHAKKRSREEKRLLQQTRYNTFGSYVDPTIPFIDSDDDEHSGKKLTTGQSECLAKILDILPDVKREFVVEKIRSQQESYTFQDEEIEILPEISTIVSELLEMEDYPKEPKIEEQIVPYERETGKTIVWTKDHRQNRDYLKDALIVLASQFDYVPTHYMNKVILEKKSLWDAFVYIDEIDRNYFQRQQRPYARSKRPRIALEKKYQRTTPYRDPDYYYNVVLELQAAKQHRMREILKKEEDQQKANEEQENLERHKVNGTIVTCGCCFDEEIPVNRAVTCLAEIGEHSFCFACVEGLANNQIGLMRHEMSCMDGSGCNAKLDMDGIGRAIPYRTFNKLLLNEQQAEIAAANLEGLVKCPFCDFKAICDPIEIDTVFSCQNPDCFKVTCRKCEEISHLPRSCEDVQNDRGLSARHKVEEARSAAMMRPCPKCKTNLIKEMGCNKMRCQCGTAMCYVCKADLSKLTDPYSHFDRNTSGGKKCALYDTPGIDRHIQEANDAEIEAIRAAKAADNTIEEKVLQIETGKVEPDIRPDLVQDRNPAGRLPIAIDDHVRRRLDRMDRRAEERIEARARRRAQVLQVPPLYIPPIRPLPVENLVWRGNIAPHTPVQPGDANVNAWRNAVIVNNDLQPNRRLEPYRGDNRQDNHPIVDNNYLEEWHDFDDFEPMDLDLNYNQQAQAQANRNQADNIAAANRLNDFRNEVHRRRASQQRRFSDRDAELPRPIVPPTLQQDNQLQAQLNQHHALLANLNQRGFRADQQIEQLGQQLNANPWRAQYRPPTPVPPNAQTNNQLQEYRGVPFRRGTILPLGNGPNMLNMQAAGLNQGQAQVQHRPQDNDFHGFL